MHFFNIATNLTPGPFVIGTEEDPEDFYLKGETRNEQPSVSGRILNAQGRLVVEFRKNELIRVIPGETRLAKKTPTTFRIWDDLRRIEYMRIETIEEKPGYRVTYVFGEFYDKYGRLAAQGNDRGLIVNCPLKL
jgi:hypothetical protein